MNLFFSSSIGRGVFFVRLVLSLFIFLCAAFLFRSILGSDSTMPSIALAAALSSILWLPGFIYLIYFGVVARLRSIGLSAWHSLFVVLPFLLGAIQAGKVLKLLPWSDLSLWTGLSAVLGILFIIYLAILFAAPKDATRSGLVQAILRDVEVGQGQFLIRLVPLIIVVMVVGLLYNFVVYHGLNDPQSMDNAQLARQIARGEGYTTKFLRPYALMQQHNFVANRALSTGADGSLFPADQFPPGTPKILPDTYNAPGYPYLLAVWFRVLNLHFDQTILDLNTSHMYKPDRVIPALNLIFMFLTALLIFRLSLRLFDDRVAWTALVIFVVSDLVWRYTLTALSTSFLMFIVPAILLCALEIFCVGEACFENEEHSFKPAWGWTLLLALLLTVACLTRLPLLVLLVPLLLLFYLMPRANFFLFPLVAVIVICLVGPWFWHMYKISGNLLGSNEPLLLYGVDDAYKGNQVFCSTSIPSYEQVFKDLSKKEFMGFRWHFERGWDLLGSSPMILLFAAALLHRFKRTRAQAFLWLLVGCALVIIFSSNLGEATPEPVSAWNTVVVLFPCMIVMGSAYFFVLLDRLNLQLWLFNNVIVIIMLVLSAVPMALTVTTSATQLYSFPPYMPPVIKLLGGLAQPDEWVTCDMPWASAWYADHGSLWLPDSISDFQNIHDSICPSGILYLTPVTWAKPISTLTTGEDKDWYPLITATGSPPNFPLAVSTKTPAGGPDYWIWSNRPRWQSQ